MSDELIIRSLASGDSATLRSIYKFNYPTIEKMVFRMNGSVDDAYDIFQDALTIAYEQARSGKLQLNCRFSTYLTAIAKNLWLKRISRNKSQSMVYLSDFSEDTPDVQEPVGKFFEMEKHMSQLEKCLDQIGEPCSGLLKAFYLQNKSMQDIADEFGYTTSENAKTQKYKCLNRLKKLFFHETREVTIR
ncbi:MAG TPA: sigma-70 family RNA polymerase sigma factor [Chitinophagaceae bacterium]|nr:sigma-70 family RNA polymerase sigma factor [Chitinophagaceae bacterium]